MIIIGEKMNIIPTVLEKESNREVAYDLYSRLLEDRIIFLSGEINDQTANLIISELLYLDAKNHDDVYMYINSPGGVVTSGLAMYDTMQYISCDVHTLCIGQACSMGSLLLTAGTKGKRFALPNSRIMIHQPSGGAQGKASDIEIQANEILKMKRALNNLYVKHTGQKLSVIEKAMDRDNFMSPEEALKFGLIDQIVANRDEIKK